MIRPARRLFDYDGYEIFRSKDIQRDAYYYVSGGEDFISPLETIEGMERKLCQTVRNTFFTSHQTLLPFFVSFNEKKK